MLPRTVILLPLLFATALGAELPARTPQEPGSRTTYGTGAGRLRIRWENDSWLSSTDRFYTNGAGIGWTLPEGATAAAVAETLSGLPFAADHATGTATELLLGQEIYTPEDIGRSDRIVDDRPYAGWLHLDLRHQVLALGTDGQRARDTLDTWLVQVGVVGPSSQADAVQRQIHEAVDAPRPQGWRNQLHDEPGLVVGYRRDFRTAYDRGWPLGLESDFEGNYRVHVGNVDTSGGLGAQARLGWNLPRHFGAALHQGSHDAPQRLFVAAGVDGRLVVRNIFLDGNSYRTSHSVSRNVLVADFHVGLFWEPAWSVRLGVTSVYRTPEFDSPSASDLGSFTSVACEIYF